MTAFAPGRIALALCALAFSTPANAQQACAPRDIVVRDLGEKYGENIAGTGIVNPTTLVELFINDETGSFTVVVSSYDKNQNQIISCLKVGGKDWVEAIPVPKGDPV
jgi:hypothetical protein